MKIKKRDEQHIVITSSLVRGLTLILIALIITVLPILLGNWALWFFSPITGFFVLVELRNIFRRVIIDKSTESIIVRKPFLGFIPRSHVIPFSSVEWVTLDGEPESHGPYGGSAATWKVSLDIRGKVIKIAQSENEAHMRYLANEIHNVIPKEQPKRPFNAQERKEAVDSFKKRMEQDAKERKKQGH